ncbi:MAG TPA: hypothetical protein VH372_26910 [Actinospica sp.]|nr:hypothetical protein [Actinospica sp.]
MSQQSPGTPGPPEGTDNGPGQCRVELVAAGRHEFVPGGVPAADARLDSLDADSRHWIEERKQDYAVFVVPAEGGEAGAASGAEQNPDRPTRSAAVSAEEYRSLLGLRPG